LAGAVRFRTRRSHCSRNQVSIDSTVEERVHPSRIGAPVHLKEVLVGQIAQLWHEGIAEQVTQPEDVLREAVGIGIVLAEAQHGVVFEQAVQHIGVASRNGI
jgi:hypothetical protein